MWVLFCWANAAKTYPWKELLGKPLSDVEIEVNKVLPDATIVVRPDGKPAYVLQYHGNELVAVIFTDSKDTVHGILIVKAEIISYVTL